MHGIPPAMRAIHVQKKPLGSILNGKQLGYLREKCTAEGANMGHSNTKNICPQHFQFQEAQVLILESTTTFTPSLNFDSILGPCPQLAKLTPMAARCRSLYEGTSRPTRTEAENTTRKQSSLSNLRTFYRIIGFEYKLFLPKRWFGCLRIENTIWVTCTNTARCVCVPGTQLTASHPWPLLV